MELLYDLYKSVELHAVRKIVLEIFLDKTEETIKRAEDEKAWPETMKDNLLLLKVETTQIPDSEELSVQSLETTPKVRFEVTWFYNTLYEVLDVMLQEMDFSEQTAEEAGSEVNFADFE